jgi:signal transduction histidine kinase
MLPGRFARSHARDEPLDYETFSTADGLATNEASGLVQRNIALTDDGRVWVATTKGLAVLDARRLVVTDTKPSIYLTSVTVGRNRGPSDAEIVLPRGTHHVQIDFAAVELSSPEKIRLQYRLDNVDSEWLDAGPSPHAIYSTLPVGRHALRIRACNRHGIWDRQGVVFFVTQQPFFYQTRWFRGTIAVVGLLMVATLYRLRVRQISRAMSARFDERLDERTRVARELHDTFLQTVQGSKMVADHALRDQDDHARMVRAMTQLSTWLERGVTEARAAVNSLRTSTTETNDLAAAFRRATDECHDASGAEVSLSVTGDSREIHPIARDEIYRIGYEAIRNACAHSGGYRVEVRLDYGHDLTLRVNDDGVGMSPDLVAQGKESHFGLRGMKERAGRIGGRLTLVSAPGSGTVISLVVPGRIAFRSPRADRAQEG